MAARSVLFLICFFLLNVGMGWCETILEKTAEPLKTKVEEKSANATIDQPDPYKNVTWNSVTSKNKEQTQAVTVYSPSTGNANFVSVTSPGAGAGVNSGVVVVAPVEKKSKKWFF